MDDKNTNKENKLYYFRELSGKSVVLKETGQKHGLLADILIEPNLLEVGAIRTSQDKWLVRPVESIPSIAVSIQYRDRDSLLVSGFELRTQGYQQVSHWLSIHDIVHGQEVVTTGGKKLGEIYDIQLDERGLVVAYQLRGQEKLIPMIATHALDSKIMIVNESVLVE